MEDESNWGPKPFRTKSAWFLNPRFKPLIEKEWHKLRGQKLQSKLIFLKNHIKNWNSITFGSIDSKIGKFGLEIKKLT